MLTVKVCLCCTVRCDGTPTHSIISAVWYWIHKIHRNHGKVQIFKYKWNKLQIISINIYSIRKHCNQWLVLLQRVMNAIDILYLTGVNARGDEVFLYTINSFNMYLQTRERKRDGDTYLCK